MSSWEWRGQRHRKEGGRDKKVFYKALSMELDDDGGRCDADEEEWDDVATLEKLGLSEYDMEDFCLINMSDTYDRRDGVSNARTFCQMKRSMLVMGFSLEDVFSVLSSNLAFVAQEDCRALDKSNAHLRHVLDLLGITTEGLNLALCYHEITVGIAGNTGKKQFKRVLLQAQAEKGVEALIKGTYAALFNYLVSRINANVTNDIVKGVEGTKAS
jgi:myosin-5